ncbi:MAG: response regulator [Candidatus Paceibacterota bacterium]|jgi:CheY-like chemotaxis protein|nr:response regulator [Candidatus Paceibacterota bacterium]
MPKNIIHFFSRSKILIIEDNDLLQKVMTDHLTDEGYSVLSANDGLRGYEMALAEHPDLILLDMMLPKMDGISLLKALRKDEWGGGAKVLITTNLMKGDELAKQLTEYRILGFLEKVDLTLGELSKKIKEALTKA